MQAIAVHKFARGSAQKARLVADQIRGANVEKALEILTFSNKKAAELVKGISVTESFMVEAKVVVAAPNEVPPYKPAPQPKPPSC